MYWSELSSRGVLGLQGEILSLQLVVLKNVCHLPAHLRMSGGEKNATRVERMSAAKTKQCQSLNDSQIDGDF